MAESIGLFLHVLPFLFSMLFNFFSFQSEDSFFSLSKSKKVAKSPTLSFSDFQDVTVWTGRATPSWALPLRIQQSLGSVTPARTEWLPAVSSAPTRMASSKRPTLEGGTQPHTDPSVSCHLPEAASGTCWETNDALVNDLSWLKCWRLHKKTLKLFIYSAVGRGEVGLKRRGREVAEERGRRRDRGRKGVREKSVLCEAWRLQPRYRW